MTQHLAPISVQTEQRELDAKNNLIARMGLGKHKWIYTPKPATQHVSWVEAMNPDNHEIHEICI